MKARIGDLDMHYELSGPAGRPVVMLSHSLGSSMIMWQPQLHDLENDYRVLRYDIRGHGDTGVSAAPYTLEQLAADAVALLDYLKIDRGYWVGLSLGGMIGQALALHYPGRVAKLALCDTTARVPPEAQPLWEQRLAVARTRGMAGLVDDTMERWLSPATVESRKELAEQIRRQFLATPVEGYIGCAEAIRRLDYLDRLSQIHLPALVIVGADDQATPVAAALAILERLPQADLVVIPNARHLSNVDQPDDFSAALLDFLS